METRDGVSLARIVATGFACAAVVALTVAASAEEEPALDPGLPSYDAESGQLSGVLRAVGSDTMSTLMTLWGEGFARHHAQVRVRVEASGSSTATAALVKGAAELAPMHRAMSGSERLAFEERFGFAPTRVCVALDALGVFVHRDNPIESLSLQQLDGAFSSTRKRGGAAADTWEDLGATSWRGEPIVLFGRNPASSGYGFFRGHVLAGGSFRDTVAERPGGSIVVREVAANRRALGYAALGHRRSGVRALSLRAAAGAAPTPPSYEQVASGGYPLRRLLCVYVARPPGAPLSPLVREFLEFVLSREGQAAVVADGYVPLRERACARERAKLR